jgi:DNA-binding LacI/PurR family transcriptional regulator
MASRVSPRTCGAWPNSDYTAHGIYKAVRDLGLRGGADVSVVGHDDLPTSELLDPPIATIRLNGRKMGRALIARLLAQALQDDYLAPVELVERASLQRRKSPGQLGFTSLAAAREWSRKE